MKLTYVANYNCYYGIYEAMSSVFIAVFGDNDASKIGRLVLENWNELFKKAKVVGDFFDDGGMLGGMEAYHKAGETMGDILYLSLFYTAV